MIDLLNGSRRVDDLKYLPDFGNFSICDMKRRLIMKHLKLDYQYDNGKIHEPYFHAKSK